MEEDKAWVSNLKENVTNSTVTAVHCKDNPEIILKYITY
jgi:hypothetical protein